jgi:hypothetical protein
MGNHTFFTKRFDRENGELHFASAMTMNNNEDTIRDNPASY